jgi:diguanylate cyclase (GGDEF)-like protein
VEALVRYLNPLQDYPKLGYATGMDDRSESIRVLLVEDRSKNAELVARLLAKHTRPRFAMTRVPTLAAALRLAQGQEWDAVLLDLSLPDSCGLAGLRELAAAMPHAPIVVLAGMNDHSIAVQAIRHGAQDCLVESGTDAGLLARSIRMSIERKSVEARLAKRANFDPLTGLVNRALLRDRLEHALARARRGPGHTALMYLDLDGFKAVNDRHGHAAGDEVLRLVAGRLRATVRAGETVARLGGDEFVVLIEPPTDGAAAAAAAERILEALRAPFPAAGMEIRVTASIGVAVFPEDAADGETLLCNSDAAMLRAKKSGRNRIRRFGSA